MHNDDIAKLCLTIIQDITGRDTTHLSSSEDVSVFELGIDSLSIIKLIFALEDRLNIDIPLADLEESTFASVHKLASHLVSLQMSKAA